MATPIIGVVEREVATGRCAALRPARARGEMPRAVAGFLPQWTAVSGIMLFQDVMFGFERVGWSWCLLSNPHAAVPLPDALSAGRANLPRS